MKTKTAEKMTTIALPSADNKRLTEYCETYGILKKDFIAIVLNYLENNGVDPKRNHAPKTELMKIKRRIDQLFGFIKTQDKEYLRPMLAAVQVTENRLQNQIRNLVVKEDLESIPSAEDNEDLALRLLNSLIKHINTNEKTLQFRDEVRLFIEKTQEDSNKKKGFFNL